MLIILYSCMQLFWLAETYYLRRRLTSGEGIVTLGVCVSVCVSVEPRLHAALVSAVKVMRCIERSLVDICVQYGLQWDVKFNAKKSHITCFGGTYPKQDYPYWKPTTVLVRVKYLGCWVRSLKNEVDPSNLVARFCFIQ